MVLEPFGLVLGPLRAILRLLEAVLGRSWGGLGRNGRPLDGQIAKMLVFHWFYKVFSRGVIEAAGRLAN